MQKNPKQTFLIGAQREALFVIVHVLTYQRLIIGNGYCKKLNVVSGAPNEYRRFRNSNGDAVFYGVLDERRDIAKIDALVSRDEN